MCASSAHAGPASRVINARGLRSSAPLAVITNECPWCRSAFQTGARALARLRAWQAIEGTGACKIDRA
eukprot:6872353-Pyramimonas_sp.AAC.1